MSEISERSRDRHSPPLLQSYRDLEIIDLEEVDNVVDMNDDTDEMWLQDDIAATLADAEGFGGSLLTSDAAQDLEMCHLLNATLLRMVDDMLTALDEEIDAVKVQLASLYDLSVCNEDGDTGGTQSQEKPHTPFLPVAAIKQIGKYYMPYFYDEEGRVPPQNAVSKERLQRHDFNVVDIQRGLGRTWSQKEISSLIRGVGLCVRDAMEKPMEIRVNSLATKRDNAITNSTTTTRENPTQNREAAQKALRVARDGLEKLRQRPLTQLARECRSPELAKKFVIDWHKIADVELKGRVSARNCELTWFHNLTDSVNVQVWSDEESESLMQVVQEVQLHSWEIVAERLNTNRTAFACLQQWNNLQKSHWLTREFSPEDDNELLQLVLDMMESELTDGVINWKLVACNMRVPHFSPHACRARWKQLNSQLPRMDTFTEMEDLQILTAVSKFGPRWDLVARDVPGRVDLAVQRRYNELMEHANPWNYDEDKRLFRFIKAALPQISPPFFVYKFYRLALVIMPNFPNRNVRSIAVRMKTLITWNNLWIRLRHATKGEDYELMVPKLVNNFVPEPWTVEDVRMCFLRTPCALDLLVRFQENGVEDAVEQVLYLLRHWTTPPNCPLDLGALGELLSDTSERQLFIPRPIFEPAPKVGHMIHNDAITQMLQYCQYALVKHLLEIPLRRELATYLDEGGPTVSHVQRLLQDECLFWLRLEEAWRHGSVRRCLNTCSGSVYEYLEMVPALGRLMATRSSTNFPDRLRKLLDEDNVRNNCSRMPQVVLPENSLPPGRVEKFRELRRLLAVHQQGPSFISKQLRTVPQLGEPYPTEDIRNQTLSLRFVPSDVRKLVLAPSSRQEYILKATTVYQKSLASNFRPMNGVQLPRIPALPPCHTSIMATHSLILDRGRLLLEGSFTARVLASVTRRRPHRGLPARRIFKPDPNSVAPVTQYMSTEIQQLHRSVVQHPSVRLFMSRALSILLWPMMISRLTPEQLQSTGTERPPVAPLEIDGGSLSGDSEEESDSSREEPLIAPANQPIVRKVFKEKRRKSRFRETDEDEDAAYKSRCTQVKATRARLRAVVAAAVGEEMHSPQTESAAKSKKRKSTNTENVGSSSVETRQYKRVRLNEQGSGSIPLSPPVVPGPALLCVPMRQGGGPVVTVAWLPREVLHLMTCGFRPHSITTSCHEFHFNTGDIGRNRVENQNQQTDLELPTEDSV